MNAHPNDVEIGNDQRCNAFRFTSWNGQGDILVIPSSVKPRVVRSLIKNVPEIGLLIARHGSWAMPETDRDRDLLNVLGIKLLDEQNFWSVALFLHALQVGLSPFG